MAKERGENEGGRRWAITLIEKRGKMKKTEDGSLTRHKEDDRKA